MNYMSNITYERLLSKIASYYYIEEKSQAQIADMLGLSKSKVFRMLSQAKEMDIVQISIKHPINTCNELEMQFEKVFNLREAIIINDNSNEGNLYELGQAGADYLGRVVTAKDVIGISWGNTLLHVVDRLQSQKVNNVEVVQLVGGFNNSGQNVQAVDLTRRVGNIFNAQPSILYCPAVVTSTDVKKGLIADENIVKVMNKWNTVTIGLVGIGSMSPNSILFKENHLSEKWHKKLMNKNIVGDLCMRFYDIDGNNCSDDLNRYIMGIEWETLRNIRTLVCVAAGIDKAEAILGALNSKIPNVLITNKTTAQEILKSI